MMSRFVLAAIVVVAAVEAVPTPMVNDVPFVDSINSVPGLTWKAGFNQRFANQPAHSFRSSLGVKADSLAAVKALPVEDNSHIADESIPDSFDSEENWPKCAKVIGDIRDQSMCGCCWAFAGASAASDRLCISTNGTIAVPLSSQDVCFNSNYDGCDGGQISTPWSYISRKGVVTGGQVGGSGPFGKGYCSDFSMPHCHHHGPQGSDPYPAEGTTGCPQQKSPKGPTKCDATATGEHKDFAQDKYTFSGSPSQASGEQGIQKAIMTGGPVETAFTVYTDFANYVSGIYSHVKGGVEGGHAVRIVGWGVDGGNKYWKVANSWNPYWGEKGYFRIKRGNNECGIEDGVTFSPASAKWTKA
jgi:cathepsin B